MAYINEKFTLNSRVLETMIPEFGYDGFGEIVFYRTYSRTTKDGRQETWADVVKRVIEGVFSIRKDHYIRNRIPWDEQFWQNYATRMAISLFKLEWCAPGRGLWAMGTDFVKERGAMALYNCAYIELTTGDLPETFAWLMDSLMCGVGVGFGPVRDDGMRLYPDVPRQYYKTVIPDSREGWCEATASLIRALMSPDAYMPVFDYSVIRPKGTPIRGFGGFASGPEPLIDLHKKILHLAKLYDEGKIDSVMFKTDVANLIGCCVIAGNVRRSAEIACGPISDSTFLDLKDYRKHQYRADHGWMSNNSVLLEKPDDFERLSEIAERVKQAGEPGIINTLNLPKGRIGKDDGLRSDRAIGFNPCGEIPLESAEVCNLSETCPTRCSSLEDWYKACEYASLYCSTVSLLPTHHERTNRVVARNRRIGVSIIDVTGWVERFGVAKVTRFLRDGYKIVRATNSWANGEAGVPDAIRVTTIKPGGTVPKVVGRNSGMMHANFEFMLRRVRVQQDGPLFDVLHDAGIPHEPDVVSANTEVFEFPIHTNGRTADKVSLWEQAALLILLQREWADNAVSNTLNFRPSWPLVAEYQNAITRHLADGIEVRTDTDSYFYENGKDVKIKYDIKTRTVKVYEYDPGHEEDIIENVLAMTAPHIKSLSLLPHTKDGVYPQMPESGISEQEYTSRKASIKMIDWAQFKNSDGEDEQFCSGPSCEIKR